METGRPGELEQAQAFLDSLTCAAREQFIDEAIAPQQVEVQVQCKLRYQNQEHSVEVPLGQHEQLDADWALIEQRFHALYAQHYTYCLQRLWKSSVFIWWPSRRSAN